MKINGFTLYCAAVLVWSTPAVASPTDYPQVRLGGLVFGDIYQASENHLDSIEGETGGVMRRAYLTANAEFNPQWFARARVEWNQDGDYQNYHISNQVKDLYLGWSPGRQKVIAGLAPTPTFDVIESYWGARYLLRTPLDLQGAPSRDTGLSLQGPINAAATLRYRLMLAGETDFEADSNKNRKLMGALNWSPAPNWVLDLYADWEDTRGGARNTIQLYGGYTAETFRFGVQYSDQDGGDSAPLQLVSGYAVGRIRENFNWIGRVDHLFKPSPRGDNISYLPFDPSADATMLVGGLEFLVRPHFRLTPNIVAIRYDRNDQGIRPENDLYFRLTLFADFE
jgi:hypothetical protein